MKNKKTSNAQNNAQNAQNKGGCDTQNKTSNKSGAKSNSGTKNCG